MKDKLQQSEDGEKLDNLKAEALEQAIDSLVHFGDCDVMGLDIDMCDVFQSILESKLTKPQRRAISVMLWSTWWNKGTVETLVHSHIEKVAEHAIDAIANEVIDD